MPTKRASVSYLKRVMIVFCSNFSYLTVMRIRTLYCRVVTEATGVVFCLTNLTTQQICITDSCALLIKKFSLKGNLCTWGGKSIPFLEEEDFEYFNIAHKYIRIAHAFFFLKRHFDHSGENWQSMSRPTTACNSAFDVFKSETKK